MNRTSITIRQIWYDTNHSNSNLSSYSKSSRHHHWSPEHDCGCKIIPSIFLQFMNLIVLVDLLHNEVFSVFHKITHTNNYGDTQPRDTRWFSVEISSLFFPFIVHKIGKNQINYIFLKVGWPFSNTHITWLYVLWAKYKISPFHLIWLGSCAATVNYIPNKYYSSVKL